MLKNTSIADLLRGKLPESEIRARLLALTPDRMDVDSLKACIDEVREFCSPEFAKLSGLGANALDCSGTGGSGRRRFNTSTACAFVISAADIPVAKFGNRAATSKSGSFDLLDHLQIPTQISATTAARILSATGLVFLFAPQAYPALAALAPIRATLGAPTVFNFIGPLLNPVSPAFRVMGISDATMQALIAALLRHGSTHGATMLIRSSCGLDELCPRCDSTIESIPIERTGGPPGPLLNAPTECKSMDKQHTPSSNAETLLRILSGSDSDSYEYNLIIQNSAAALLTSGKCDSWSAAESLAKSLISSGAAYNQLKKVQSEYAKHS